MNPNTDLRKVGLSLSFTSVEPKGAGMTEIVAATIGAVGVIIAAVIAAFFAGRPSARPAVRPDQQEDPDSKAICDLMNFTKILSAALVAASPLDSLLETVPVDIKHAEKISADALSVFRYSGKHIGREDRRYLSNLLHLLKQARARRDFRRFLALLREARADAVPLRMSALRARGITI